MKEFSDKPVVTETKEVNWGINLFEGSSVRGFIWLIGGFAGIISTIFQSIEHGAAIMSITAMIAGGLGVVIKSSDG